MRAPLVAALAAAVVGCSYPEERFRAEVDDAVCQWQLDCFDYDQSWSQCVAESAETWTQTEAGCAYDEDMASACVDGIDQMECPESGEVPGFPSACDRVWSCP